MRRNIASNPKFASWYRNHLRDYTTVRGRDVDFSQTALGCLQALDPTGTTWGADGLSAERALNVRERPYRFIGARSSCRD
jgi:hypothetical protein